MPAVNDDGLLFSIVIYTYNRADILVGALDSAIDQDFSLADYEVVVVDNASTDHTRAMIEQRIARAPQVRYVYEAQRGSSAARNAGWHAALGRYVAFLDDDAKAPPDWLSQAQAIVDQHAPHVIGGPYVPFYIVPKPLWFRDVYGARSEGDSPGWLPDERYLSGSNLFVRRDLLELSGGFDTRAGMFGARIGFGEETLLLRQLRRRLPQARIYYSPALQVQHLVRPEKYRLGWQWRMRLREGRSGYLTFADGPAQVDLQHWLALIALPLLIAYQGGPGVLLRSRRRYPYWQNYYFEVVFQSLARWARQYERIRQWLRQRLGQSAPVKVSA